MSEIDKASLKKFDHFGSDTWDDILNLGTLRRYSAGTVLLQQGDIDDKLIIVIEGRVAARRTTASAKYRVGMFRGRGDALSHPSVHLSTPKFFSFSADEDDTIILELSLEDLYSLCQKHRDFLVWVTGDLSGQLLVALDQLRQDRELSADARLARRLYSLADETGHISLTQEEIGHHMGISRVTVSKCLSELEKESILVRKYGRIELLDRSALRAWISAN